MPLTQTATGHIQRFEPQLQPFPVPLTPAQQHALARLRAAYGRTAEEMPDEWLSAQLFPHPVYPSGEEYLRQLHRDRLCEELVGSCAFKRLPETDVGLSTPPESRTSATSVARATRELLGKPGWPHPVCAH